MEMNIRQGLSQRQELRQVMTPQLQQAIKLLQYNQLDLIDHIQNELVENPALEEIAEARVEADKGRRERELEQQGRDTNNDLSEQQNGSAENETDWQKILDGYSSQAFSRGARGSIYDDLPPIENTLSTSQSLGEHLEWQLQMQSCTDAERRCAAVMLRNLDERGYLALELDKVAAAADAELDDAEGAQMIIQQLDPIGCASRGLAEVLVVQAKHVFAQDPFIVQIITDHLQDFECRNYQGVARAMELELEDVIEYHKMLQQLEPWPGRGYADADPQYITPDVYLFKVGDEWQIVLNEDGMPKLRISGYYRKVLAGAGTKEDRQYVKDKLDSADFLIKSIHKRQVTIRKVMSCILRRQRDFFEKGVDHLRPMILRDVADEIEVHESTVSRVTTNKYVQCPQGILELKYFFNAGLQTATGDDMAAVAVKARIKALIEAENPKKPLSDQALALELKKGGIRCARRTVAKYREAMGILSSSKRKRLF